MKLSVATAMAMWMSFQGRMRRWMYGKKARMTMVARAKDEMMTPMVVADSPMPTPKIGTTNMWVSHAPDSSMLAAKTRWSDFIESRSRTLRFFPSCRGAFAWAASRWERMRSVPSTADRGPSASRANA